MFKVSLCYLIFLLINVNIARKIILLFMPERQCLECGEKLKGRIDQKFCCDQCRNSYNNRLNQDANKSVRRINGILRKNRRILSTLNPDGKVTVDGVTLAEFGFNFHYYTNIYVTKTGSTRITSYNVCYTKLLRQLYLQYHDRQSAHNFFMRTNACR